MLDFDSDDGAGNDWWLVVFCPSGSASKFGVESSPGLDDDVAVAGVVGVGFGPCVGFGQSEAGAVAAGPADSAGLVGSGVGMEDPSGADPGEELGVSVGEFVAQSDGVIAGVEDEHRRRIGRC